MSIELRFALQLVFDILMTIIIIGGLVNEKKLIRFEKRLKLRLAKILYKLLLPFHKAKENIKKKRLTQKLRQERYVWKL